MSDQEPLKCQHCERMDARRSRQNTYYVDEESNWKTLCPDCEKENDEYWAEQWAEYWATIGG